MRREEEKRKVCGNVLFFKNAADSTCPITKLVTYLEEHKESNCISAILQHNVLQTHTESVTV